MWSQRTIKYSDGRPRGGPSPTIPQSRRRIGDGPSPTIPRCPDSPSAPIPSSPRGASRILPKRHIPRVRGAARGPGTAPRRRDPAPPAPPLHSAAPTSRAPGAGRPCLPLRMRWASRRAARTCSALPMSACCRLSTASRRTSYAFPCPGPVRQAGPRGPRGMRGAVAWRARREPGSWSPCPGASRAAFRSRVFRSGLQTGGLNRSAFGGPGSSANGTHRRALWLSRAL